MPAATALPSPTTLLRDVLVDPFGLTDELLIGQWLNELAANFPLLSFQSSEFAEYYPKAVPVTYPLQIFINRSSLTTGSAQNTSSKLIRRFRA